MSVHQRGGRPRLLTAAAAVLVVAGAGVLGLALSAPGVEPVADPGRTSSTAGPPAPAPPRPPQPVVEEPAAAVVPPAPSAGAVPDAVPAPDLGPVLPSSEPVGLTIPSIGVDADVLEALSLDADGVLPAPVDYALPGWYTGGPRPGQFGPAVIAGHVDGPGGPAVFYRLAELAVGATVDVARADGTTATFVIDSVERYAKAEFPTSRVYGNTTDRAEIRLITCGGAYDRTTGHYVDNIVAFGHLVG